MQFYNFEEQSRSEFDLLILFFSAESVEQIKVVLTKDDLPLGCNVRLVEGPSPGLYVMSIDPGSSAERDGTLRLGDRVVNVNGVDLTDIPLVRYECGLGVFC